MIINTTVEGRTSTKDARVERLRQDVTFHKKSKSGIQSQPLPPKSYISNSNTEKICLAITSDFECHSTKDELQYKKSIYLSPENEFGIPKCVCTTLKPELLPYPAVYDVEGCSEFVSQYMEFEPLKDPCCPPKCLPSPSQVLSWGIGDCFDLSVLLVSFLIGSGYDAYVVFGIAPEWICRRDRSTLSFCNEGKLLSSQPSLGNQLDSIETIIVDLQSLSREKKDRLDEIHHQQEHQDSSDEDDERNDDQQKKDILDGERIHCWVAVKASLRSPPGTMDFFVEPSTGERYPLNEEKQFPYLRILAMWNTRNYWINNCSEYAIPSELNIDCHNDWHSVFFNSSLESSESQLTKEASTGSRKPFDPPFSWVQRLTIPQDSFSFQYPPDGRRVILCDKVKLEFFSEGVHKQGLIQRVTTYSDRNMIYASCCEEYFGKKRGDHLLRRVRLPQDHSFHDDYSPKHSYSLSKWMEICGRRRILKFRKKGRTDGLVIHDECFGEILVHTYSGRRDGLYQRTTYLDLFKGAKDKRKESFIISTTDGTQNVTVTKIIEKYKPAVRESDKKEIAARIFILKEKNIVTEYFKKNGGIEREISTYSNQRNQDSIPQNTYQHEIMNAEKVTVTNLRSIIQEISDLVRMRKREEDVVRVDFTLKDDNGSTRTEMSDTPDSRGVDDKLPRHMDYLAPFLLHVKDLANITGEEAMQINDACLSTCKDRLLQRADIMQNRLHEENTSLSDIQAKYQQNSDKSDVTKKEFEESSSKITFRIKILEKRLRDHEDTSIEKYKALESKLHKDLNLSLTQTS